MSQNTSGTFQMSVRYETLAAGYEGLFPCRVVTQEKGQYRILSSKGEQATVVSRKYQYGANAPSDYPAVGDYVMADLNDGRASGVLSETHAGKYLCCRQ